MINQFACGRVFDLFLHDVLTSTVQKNCIYISHTQYERGREQHGGDVGVTEWEM